MSTSYTMLFDGKNTSLASVRISSSVFKSLPLLLTCLSFLLTLLCTKKTFKVKNDSLALVENKFYRKLDEMHFYFFSNLCFFYCSLREMDYEALNPDIDRPSPPRAGAARLFENPFDLTDEDSVPVEPKKLSPSHVFESTSLEDSLLLLEAEKVTDAVSPLSESGRASSLTASSSLKRRPFDTRTFVIRRTSPASSIQYETTASKASTPTTSREEASVDTAEVIFHTLWRHFIVFVICLFDLPILLKRSKFKFQVFVLFW